MSPSLLLLSGMHGDEYEIISCVHKYIKNHNDALPEFLFIDQVSPSALTSKSRKNKYGHDINRQFLYPPTDPEVQTLMDKLKDFQFKICIDFHEDSDRMRGFYVYDTGQLVPQALSELRSAITTTGASLYTGIDDPADAHLGWHVRDGYISMPFEAMPQTAGFSGRWLLENKIVQRAFTVEVPGQALPFLKQKIVNAIFDTLLPLALDS